MSDFGVLNTRKRGIIALIHSFVFLGIAAHGFASPKYGMLHRSGAMGDFILLGIYPIVASILAWLVTLSRCVPERVYFSLCTCSATFGLLRTIYGDTALPVAQYMRVIMLSSAAVVGFLIVRTLSRATVEPARDPSASLRAGPATPCAMAALPSESQESEPPGLLRADNRSQVSEVCPR